MHCVISRGSSGLNLNESQPRSYPRAWPSVCYYSAGPMHLATARHSGACQSTQRRARGATRHFTHWHGAGLSQQSDLAGGICRGSSADFTPGLTLRPQHMLCCGNTPWTYRCCHRHCVALPTVCAQVRTWSTECARSQCLKERHHTWRYGGKKGPLAEESTNT